MSRECSARLSDVCRKCLGRVSEVSPQEGGVREVGEAAGLAGGGSRRGRRTPHSKPCTGLRRHDSRRRRRRRLWWRRLGRSL